MADLVTHLASGLLVKAFGGRRHVAPMLLGTCLPDLLGRVPGLVASAARNQGLPLPDLAIYGFGVLHMPLGMLAFCGLASLFFARVQRKAAFLNLTAGCFLHLGVDLLQHHEGTGYPLLFPFTTWHWEAGLIGSEATVPWSPVFAALALAAWWATGRGWRGPRPPVGSAAEPASDARGGPPPE